MRRTLMLLVSFVPFAVFAADSAPTANPGTIPVGIGETRTIGTRASIQRVAVGDPAIADAKVLSDRQLELKGNSEGKTTVLVWLTDGSRVSYVAAVRPNASRAQLTVKVGESRDMSDIIKGPVSRIAVGDPSVVEMKTGEHWALELVGKAEGKTTFIVWTTDNTRLEYDVTVAR